MYVCIYIHVYIYISLSDTNSPAPISMACALFTRFTSTKVQILVPLLVQKPLSVSLSPSTQKRQ